MPVAFTLVFGLVMGSFISVVAHRLPRGESIVAPRSACTGCGNQIAAYDNVPVVSWIVLRGRCRHCGEAISPRYPIVELALGLAYVGCYLAFTEPGEFLLGIAFVTMLAAITLTDLEFHLIPNKILAVALATGIGIVALDDPASFPERGIALAAAGGLMLLAAIAYPKGMGMGDVKLTGVMGFFLGEAVAPALLCGLFAGAVTGMAIIAAKGAEGRKTGIPFGPYLALGGLVGLFAGEPLIDWYLGTFVQS